MKQKVLTGFLATMLAISGVIVAPSIETVEAQSLSEIRTKKVENDEKKKRKQSELSKVKSEKAAIQKQVNQFNKQIENTTKKIVENQDKIIKNQNEIEELEVEIEETEIRIAERDELLKERVRSMHVNGGAINYLEVLLGSQGFGDFLDRVLALNVIAEQDRIIIEEQKADKILLEENKAEVEKLVAQIKAEQEQLDDLKKELTSQLDQKENMLSEIKEEEEHLHAEYEELEDIAGLLKEQEKAFASQVATSGGKKESKSTGGGKVNKPSPRSVKSNKPSPRSVKSNKPISSSGKLIMPTHGIYQRGFGNGHFGIDISNINKPPIRAAASGTVVRVKTGCAPRVKSCGGGFGNHIIIAHTLSNGEKIATLYAHLDPGSIKVKTGQSVAQGAVIGKMGNTGRVSGRTGIHLHFEVHKGGYSGRGSAVNPKSYF
ncbi:murein hydrolase activator EnvC family protein [Pueribacillus sp. YX66]|uniref:murein hydrolase activator EnvC family protein n=1 Tax=Pueribacillus sp. YX66 TaxID=3229242 RepID=UPI00358D55CF